jgi:molybdopterin molybdotransferase
MISVNEAKQIILDNCPFLEPLTIRLEEAGGFVLANDVHAPADIPQFDQSSMDGYAFSFADWEQQQSLTIDGEVPAGLTSTITTPFQHTTRVFTGAAIPLNTDTVVMQEKVEVVNNQLFIRDEFLKLGTNIRPIGAEIKAGALALQQGSNLTPAAIGFLIGIGVTEVSIHPSPTIKIIVTGNELKQPGETLQHGQVYESNSFAIKAGLSQMHVNNVAVSYANDNPAELQQQINNTLANCDLLILTGGVSVGDYDFVVSASKACGIEQLFHKVKQKPGKPLFVGKRNKQLVFGLPGNPSAVITCFYEYIVPVIEQMMHRQTSCIEKKWSALTTACHKKSGLTHFLKAFYSGNKVTISEAQESFRLSSFATANCLVCLAEEETDYLAGDLVEVHQFPY